MSIDPCDGDTVGDGQKDSGTIARLVLRAKAGDKEAQDKLLEEFQGPLFGIVYAIIRRQEIAEECLQEVFIAIMNGLSKLRDPERFSAWARSIARNEAMRYGAKERRPISGAEDLELAADKGPPLLTCIENCDLCDYYLEDVPPAATEALWLHLGEEMSLEEVATAIGRPMRTVQSLIRYWSARLRKKHADCEN